MKTSLSKSKYMAGLQCLRRLWLGSHAPDLGTPATASLAAVLDQGAEIGRHARDLFPGGALVDEEAWQHGQATARTRQLMADRSVGAIFEAAFEHAGVRVRVDVLERLGPRTWGLREVKQGASVKDVYLEDVAVQRFVVEGTSVRLGSVEVIHIDRDYVRGDDGIDWPRFFRRADVIAETAALLPDVPARVRAFRRVLAKRATPEVEPSLHCFDPYACEFWAHCTVAKPVDWIVGGLPGLNGERLDRLRAAGIERISEIPDDFRLGPAQARTRAAWLVGGLYLEPRLAAALRRTGPPALYLDFETAFPAIPLYAVCDRTSRCPSSGRCTAWMPSGACCTANSSPTAGPTRAPPSPRRCSRRCATGASPSWCGRASNPSAWRSSPMRCPRTPPRSSVCALSSSTCTRSCADTSGTRSSAARSRSSRWRPCSPRRSRTTTSTA
jgi:hypothetical protein